jgi:hypothetical protein
MREAGFLLPASEKMHVEFLEPMSISKLMKPSLVFH